MMSSYDEYVLRSEAFEIAHETHFDRSTIVTAVLEQMKVKDYISAEI